MTLLTQENLANNPFQYTDYNAFARGKDYFATGRVQLLDFDGESATCRVVGNQDNYVVIARAASRDRVNYTCNCPQAAKVRVCKHMVAAMLAIREYIRNSAENQWQYRLALALEKSPKQKKTREISQPGFIALLGLDTTRVKGGDFNFRMFPYRVSLDRWHPAAEIQQFPGPAEISEYMDTDRSWAQFVDTADQPFDFGALANIPAEGMYLLNLFISSGGYYHNGISQFYPYLPLLETLHIPIFVLKDRVFKENLHVQTTPATIESALTFDGENYTLQAGVRIDGEVYSTAKDNLHMMQYGSPAWALAGKTIVPIGNPEALELMHYFPVVIPKQDEQKFRERFFQQIAERLPIHGDVISWVDVNEKPVPRLYLKNTDAGLRADLRFGYGEHELQYHPKAPSISMVDITGTWGALRVHRQLEEENHYQELLTEARYGLKRCGVSQPGVYEIRARVHPYDFLTRCIPALTTAGFEIFGDKNIGKVNRSRPVIRLSVSSGIDWFDLQAVVQYGDQEVSLSDVRKALKRGDAYVKLADGAIGQIPSEWLERYRHLFDLAEETETGLRVSDMQLTLVDELLADSEQQDITPAFFEKRERLKQFENITVQPLPQGFTGQLRPYQKFGLDWLHFLADFGFGGILADDMGLGKTIQVLVFLQSLHEQGKANAPTLLVVPKSLLANWQREAARFTPALRFLEFMGNFRKKDPDLFQDFDVILTTYGTMLRDVEFLRATHFHYIILDESQAIKNPLAQSSKAVRLLKADHRLVMTGTPVENNTFELWSQFAFLNPGLLGNLESFKREFATPIEDGQADTTSLLRRMVYPFILRRTKDQVAPELPPRTERLIFTDLSAAQRKLYNHTRDIYRSQLLEMVNDEGIDDARMKILEGLLRLRQVCIHPRLVDPTYHGDVAKFELVLETLQTLHSEGHKALVFSQFVQTLQLLKVELERLNLPYTYLDGQTRDRQARVDTFQNDPNIAIFLISLKAGGVGLNLTAADYVLHLDPWWNPAVEMQASDRAHRIGQDKPVFVYKYIARDTVEEKILQLQDRKKDLVEQLISTEGSFFKSLTRDDIQALFG